ncbi:MAG: septum formation inhibitor Maf [Actinobacteria bacterium]|nr:septum formation inhibitor Maf [Actinomycetota bacterium]
MRSRPFVLASASPARLRLLQQAGVDPHVIVSGVDEEAVAAGLGPRETAEVLALAKAEAVAQGQLPVAALVLGCDSVFEFEQVGLGKPRTPEEALARGVAMSGRSGTLWTGHTLIDSAAGVTVSEVVGTTVHFAEFSTAEMQAYVATGEPMQVAGGFTLDGLGAALVLGVDGDPGNVIGVSVPCVRRLVKQLGLEWYS